MWFRWTTLAVLLGVLQCTEAQPVSPSHHLPSPGHGGSGGGNYPNTVYYYDIPVRQPLLTQPGSAMLLPTALVNSTSITLAPITYKLYVPEDGLAVRFVTPGYIDDKSKQATAFGPSLRLKRGQSFQVLLTNAMVDTTPVRQQEANAHDSFYGPMNTNLHLHGLHAATGVGNQATAAFYRGDDNIFSQVLARSSPTAPPNKVRYYSRLPTRHLPGLFWGHPHKHGSTTIQVSTAHFAVIVEDDPDLWMPQNGAPGCSQVRQLLATAPDMILDITLLFFKYTADPNNPNNTLANLDDANLQLASNISGNPYCCNKPTTNGHPFVGTYTQGMGRNVFLVNGGYQPVISMVSGSWYRWRLLFSGSKGFAAITIVDPATNKPAPDCELQLVAKDGIYLMALPRKVSGLVLPSGGRLELLVRCSAAAGQTRVLNAGAAAAGVFSNSSFGNIFWPTGNPYLIQQEVLATIQMQPPSGPNPVPSLTNEACVPLRPAYAADLRDEALIAAKYNPADIDRQEVAFTFNRQFACEVNGEVFKFPDPKPLEMPLGKIKEWVFNDVTFHPLHVHTNPFQLVGINESLIYPGNQPGDFFKIGDYYDTLLFPLQTPLNNDAVRVRFQPGSYSGYSVMHCHYLQHEDQGCIKTVLWRCPGFGVDNQPRGKCPGFNFPVPGTVK